MDVRHLAPSAQGNRVAAGAFETQVGVWDLPSGKHRATFDSVLDYGGERLAMSPDGSLVLAAGYDRRGVACYESTTGELRWARRDLTRIQHLRTSPKANVAYACADIRSCHVLDLATGETVDRLRGVRDVFEGASPNRFLVQTRPRIEGLRPVDLIGFAVLDAAFSHTQIAVAEARGPVRVFDLSRGMEVWRWTPAAGSHVTDLAYADHPGAFVGVLRRFEDRGASVLGAFSSAGRWVAKAVLGQPATVAFCQSGTRLLVSDGRLIDTATGAEGSRLDFATSGSTRTTLTTRHRP